MSSLILLGTHSTIKKSTLLPEERAGRLPSSIKLSANAHLFLRGEDLFNQQLEEMRDYNGNPYAVSGRAFRLGLKWRF